MNNRGIQNSKQLGIRNTESLPRGLNAPYLECIEGLYGELVAKKWRRKIPLEFQVIVKFGE